MKNFIIKLFIIVIALSCKQEAPERERFNTALKLVQYMNDGDTSAIISLFGFNDREVGGKTSAIIFNDCNLAKEYFKTYGSSKFENFRMLEDPKNPVVNSKVIIPIRKEFDSSNGLINAELEISFAPKNILPYSKILTYNLVRNYSDEKMKLIKLKVNN